LKQWWKEEEEERRKKLMRMTCEKKRYRGVGAAGVEKHPINERCSLSTSEG